MLDIQVPCERCGEPTTNYRRYSATIAAILGKEGCSICDRCRRWLDLIGEWENEQYRKDEITCPWCGYRDPDSWEFEDEYDEDYRCPSCGRPFVLEAAVERTYTSRRRAEDMPAGWTGDGEAV